MKLLLIALLSCSAMAADKVVARRYFNSFLGHVHKNPAMESSSLTIVQCQHSVKILQKENIPNGWSYVQVGEDRGYIADRFLSSKRPQCFQDKYPHFYNGLNLDISEMYFWGRLNDHYLQGKTRIK